MKCVLVCYSQPLTSIFGLVNSSIKKMRLECRLTLYGKRLEFAYMTIPDRVAKEITFCGSVHLNNVYFYKSASGLLKTITCDGLNSLEELHLQQMDVSCISVNTINTLVKMVKKSLRLEKVTGFSLSILQNIKCERLDIRNMRLLPTKDKDFNVSISGKVRLEKLSGHVTGLLNILSCDCLMIEKMKLDKDATRNKSGQGNFRG